MAKLRVAVIGAGICGLSALKETLAEGLDAVCFEARNEIGGGWAYQADVSSGSVQSSIYAGTVMNSCRDTSSFSDFPLDPARYTDYFNHRLLLRYLREYADYFRLVPYIRLQTRVLKVAPQEDGTWKLAVQKGEDPNAREEVLAFDAVIVAAGHLTTPRYPSVPGRDTFKGQAMHSHFYRTPGPYEGKRVAIVGFGSSAIDIACEIAPHAQELHLITRRGGWVLPRFIFGKPTEAYDNRATQLWVPTGISQWLQTKLLNFVQGPPSPKMMPDHKILEQNPTIRGDFFDKLNTGLINLHRGEVVRMDETSITVSPSKGPSDKPQEEAKAESVDVDVVIFATGYEQFDLPYLPADALRSASTPAGAADLFRFIHPLTYHNLFLHGYFELHGPLPACAEAQARYTAAVLTGRVQLPTAEKMAEEIAAFRAWNRRNFVHSERHLTTGHQIAYIDGLLEELGAAPAFSRLLGKVFTSNPLKALGVLNAVWFGIPSSAQWRLLGHGAKPELATATLLRTAAEEPVLRPAEAAYLKARQN